MATYFMGDVQGCYEPMMRLLDKIQFDDATDQLYLCGDVVNRGPQSLQVMQFLLDHPAVEFVLGNHDIYALYYLLGGQEIGHQHTLVPLLTSPLRDDFIQRLLQANLMIYQPGHFAVVHAGIVPQWNVKQAYAYSQLWRDAVEQHDPLEVVQRIWGNDPCDNEHTEDPWDRLRYVVNVLTRLRFCDADGCLDFHSKMTHCPLQGYRPWFEWREGDVQEPIFFGHWAALEGVQLPGIIGLDTGCAWGGTLTAYAFAEQRCVSVPA